MSRDSQGAPLWRCLVVWLVASAASAVLVSALRSEVAPVAAPNGARFDELFVAISAAALVVCAVWLWVTATAVVAAAVLGSSRRLPGCPDAVRRAVLLACGAALLIAAAPAAADPVGRPPRPDRTHLLAGLPMPDRPSVGPAGAGVVVRVGDTLWDLGRRTLPAGAGAAAVDARWRAIWAANRSVVGPDPDLIHPGAVLRLSREES